MKIINRKSPPPTLLYYRKNGITFYWSAINLRDMVMKARLYCFFFFDFTNFLSFYLDIIYMLVNFFRVPWDLVPSEIRHQIEWSGKSSTTYLVHVLFLYCVKQHIQKIYNKDDIIQKARIFTVRINLESWLSY